MSPTLKVGSIEGSSYQRQGQDSKQEKYSKRRGKIVIFLLYGKTVNKGLWLSGGTLADPSR